MASAYQGASLRPMTSTLGSGTTINCTEQESTFTAMVTSILAASKAVHSTVKAPSITRAKERNTSDSGPKTRKMVKARGQIVKATNTSAGGSRIKETGRERGSIPTEKNTVATSSMTRGMAREISPLAMESAMRAPSRTIFTAVKVIGPIPMETLMKVHSKKITSTGKVDTHIPMATLKVVIFTMAITKRNESIEKGSRRAT